MTYIGGNKKPLTRSPQSPSTGTSVGSKDRSIIMQSIAKAVIEADAKLIASGKPPMDEEYIRARVHFLYDLAAEVLAWG